MSRRNDHRRRAGVEHIAPIIGRVLAGIPGNGPSARHCPPGIVRLRSEIASLERERDAILRTGGRTALVDQLIAAKNATLAKLESLARRDS